MSRIKITEQQYNKILLSEENKRLNENKLLNENTNKVLLVIASLAGIDLTGNNKTIADKSKQDPNIMTKVRSTLENEDNLKDLVEKLEEKGLKNPNRFLSTNAEKIIKNYNEISDDKLDFYNKTILKELDQDYN